jgi:hypothetical protein
VTVMTTFARTLGTAARVALAAAMLCIGASGTAVAQDDPNPGAITFTGGLDVPTVYFFRGIRQEADPALTLWPYGDIGLALYSGDGGVKTVGVNVGVWNSLHTGSSGSDGPSKELHYELDFYTSLSLGFGGGVTLGTTYMALTSPNNMFSNVKELQFKVTKAHMLAPYGFLAFELGDDTPGLGQADTGLKKGTYLELGVGPSWTLGDTSATLAVPVKLGLSLSDYYEGVEGDEKLGFFDIGGLVTFPLAGVPSSFGAWNVHAGADLLVFGDTTKALNAGDKTEVVALFGIGVSY